MPKGQYVSTTGSDTNDGLTPTTAKLTLQSAVNALSADNGGVIMVSPGRYDVGAGLTISGSNIAFLGPARVNRYSSPTGQTQYGGPEAVIYSSLGAAALVSININGGNHWGCEFRNLVFEFNNVNNVYGIKAENLNNCLVDNCYFWARNDINLDAVVAIYSYVNGTYGDDQSWWTISNNKVSQCALAQMGSGTVGQTCNRHLFLNNDLFGRGVTNVTAKPAIKLYYPFGVVGYGNKFEGYATGYYSSGGMECVEIGGTGEKVNVFIDLYGSVGGYYAPMGVDPRNAWIGGDHPWLVRGDASTLDNVIILPGIMSAAGGYTWATHVSVPTANKVITSKGDNDPTWAAATTLGSVNGKVAVYDANGIVKGYIPTYGSIT